MLDILEQNIDEIVIESLDAGAYKARQLLTERVFIENKTIDGTSFGEYKSEAYKEYRQSLGYQVVKKSLQLTQNLLKSIVQKDNTVVFNDTISEEKAGWQEDSKYQINKPIFDLSEDERIDCLRVIDETFTKQIEDIANGISATI